jgi:hypothetical protein
MKIDKGVPIPHNWNKKKTSKFAEDVARMEPGDSIGGFATQPKANSLAITIRRYRGKKATVRREEGKKTYRVWMLDEEFTPGGRKRRSKK